MKAKKHKLRFKPTPISRLRHYTSPIKMVGDPEWSGYGKRAWANREKAVYAHEMDRKGWPMAWSPELWKIALDHNEYIDMLVRNKWADWLDAWEENAHLHYEEALRDNAAWDYHHEHFIAA